jgi:hypothetical protein
MTLNAKSADESEFSKLLLVSLREVGVVQKPKLDDSASVKAAINSSVKVSTPTTVSTSNRIRTSADCCRTSQSLFESFETSTADPVVVAVLVGDAVGDEVVGDGVIGDAVGDEVVCFVGDGGVLWSKDMLIDIAKSDSSRSSRKIL